MFFHTLLSSTVPSNLNASHKSKSSFHNVNIIKVTKLLSEFNHFQQLYTSSAETAHLFKDTALITCVTTAQTVLARKVNRLV